MLHSYIGINASWHFNKPPTHMKGLDGLVYACFDYKDDTSVQYFQRFETLRWHCVIEIWKKKPRSFIQVLLRKKPQVQIVARFKIKLKTPYEKNYTRAY